MFCKNKYIILFLSVLFFSCDEDGTIFTGAQQQEEDLTSNLLGNGCSQSTLCYDMNDLFYDFNSSHAVSQDYYKYNLIDIVQSDYSDDLDNLFYLNAFNSEFFIAVPTSSIISDEEIDDVILVDEDGNYSFNTQIIATLNQESFETKNLSSQIDLNSTNFNVLQNVIWNEEQGRYNFSTATAEQKTTTYLYSQDYDSICYVTLIDTVLTPIYGDIVLIDSNYVYSLLFYICI